MLKYETDRYVVDYLPQNKTQSVTKEFNAEDSAVNYIKANRDKWAIYRLQKIQKAIIDF